MPLCIGSWILIAASVADILDSTKCFLQHFSISYFWLFDTQFSSIAFLCAKIM